MKILRIATTDSCALAFCLFFSGCEKTEPIDDAKAAGKTTADFPQITADVFKPMDGGIELRPAEIMGRNTWNLWTGGNQYFWDRIAREGYGLIDLLKMVDSRKAADFDSFITGIKDYLVSSGPDGSETPNAKEN
jgi:hypothetical protein